MRNDELNSIRVSRQLLGLLQCDQNNRSTKLETTSKITVHNYMARFTSSQTLNNNNNDRCGPPLPVLEGLLFIVIVSRKCDHITQ